MKFAYIVVGGLVLLVLTPVLGMFAYNSIVNPGVERELRQQPDGERAQKVMLLTLPSGRTIPVNFLAENGRVYAGADGRWWTELRDGPHDVSVWVKGETTPGRARAVVDDPDYTKDVFSRLRPSAIPGFGTLVEVLLDPADPGGPVEGAR